ncbi:SPOR domain-containing protein [Parahaliea mediterranea]|uniref:SPOR domain-containing protein n=1 Tax=Parahaliea mediterranea TaxID=651086 RepID=A0A939DJN3_9GAMM|nr:SPOR domain-containing protein [Parahaliea mediterranea]
MNDVLKQRLVGALILVALGVVFWPIIFVEPETGRGGVEARIPPRPDVDTTPLSPPDRVGLRGSPPLEAAPDDGAARQPVDEIAGGDGEPSARAPVAETPAQQPDADAAEPAAEPAAPVARPEPAGAGDPNDTAAAVARRTRDEPPAQPKLDAQGVPVAWMLQVISVSRKDRAEQTRDALGKMGYKAYIKPARVEGKTVYRVYVGPKFERARLDAIKAEVDREFGVNSMVRRYLP